MPELVDASAGGVCSRL